VSLTAKDRFRIMWRDHFTCLYCGAKPPNVALQIDHFVPVSRGGSDADFNLITACVSCNQGKSDFPANYSCTGCVRPMCGGPEYSRDWAESACRCECHVCEPCESVKCKSVSPGGGPCAKEQAATDYSNKWWAEEIAREIRASDGKGGGGQ